MQYVKCNLAKIQKCMGKISFFVFCYKKSVKFLTISDKRKIIITVYIGKHWINHFTHLVCIFSVSSPKKSSQYVSIPAVFWTNWRKIWRHNLCKWFNQCFLNILSDISGISEPVRKDIFVNYAILFIWVLGDILQNGKLPITG